MTKRLVVIDGKSVFYRGFYAMPNLSTKDGTPTGGVFGFATLTTEIIGKLKPDYVCVAWDKKGTSISKRLKILPTYKAGRSTPPADFFAQIPILRQLLEAFGWPLLEVDNYEADDIMGTLARQAEQQGVETILISSDLDMLQMVSPLTKMYALKKGFSQVEKFDIDFFEQKHGIKVGQFLDFKALKGDSSDNIPGVPGVGETTAIKLLQDYGTLKNIYDHLDEQKGALKTKLENGKNSAFMSRDVARIMFDAPVKFDPKTMDVTKYEPAKIVEILQKLEFKSLIAKLPPEIKQADNQKSVEPTEDLITLTETDFKTVPDAKQVFVHLESDQLFVTFDQKTFSKIKVSQAIINQITDLEIVALDVKEFLHTLDKIGIQANFKQVYDVRQAEFLLNPLRSDTSLAGIISAPTEIETDGAKILAGLIKAKNNQTKAFDQDLDLKQIAKILDFPMTEILFKIEQRGVKIDTKYFEKISQELAENYAKLESEIYDMVGYEFNIGSPKQLSEVLFTKLMLPTNGIKKGKTGYSTGQKELDKLRGLHPIIELIEQTREIAKMKSTYVDSLPKLTDENGRLHTTFHQNITATGRLSSTNPNLQNIPARSELGKKVRQGFIAEPGQVLISADYSQFELRLAAVLSGDEQLVDDFNHGVDIHTKTAADINQIPPEEVTKIQRRAAKVINFGVLYGMSPQGLSVATGMSFAESKRFIDRYFSLRKPIKDYIEKTLTDAKQNGFVKTFYGRKRPTPDLNSSNFFLRQAAERAAANMPIQGTEADLMKRAMIRVEKELTKNQLGQQIMQIHDSILVEAPEQNAPQIAEILKTEMENIAPELKIKLDVEVSIGKDWSEL